jgi:hypothetical protein
MNFDKLTHLLGHTNILATWSLALDGLISLLLQNQNAE